ncbi:MAG TPA: twin-arginine translocase subunit TatC [Desulfobacterales bacterium]
MLDIRRYTNDSHRLLDYLETLRVALIRIGIVVVVLSVAAYPAAGSILDFLQQLTGVHLAAFGIPEIFLALVTLALGGGVFAGFPFLLYSLMSPLPALFPTFRRSNLVVFWIAATLMFYVGALFSLLVSLPYGVSYLLSFESGYLSALISVKKFVSFCLLILFGFGTIFELPLVMILSGRVGLVRAGLLSRYRRYAVMIISVVAAVLTPTPDVLNMALMGVPLYLLFELGLLGMRLSEKMRSMPPTQ